MTINLKDELDKLAASIVSTCTSTEKVTDDEHKCTPLPEKVDALKALTAYYALQLKHKGKSLDDPDGGTFSDFSTAMDTDDSESENGGTKVRSRTGHA